MNPEPRTLFVAWQCPENRAIYPVARLVVRDDRSRYEFVYVEGVHEALPHGFVPFARMGALDRIYLSDALFPLFDNRVMPPSRPDFADHVARLGLEGSPEPVVLLARSEGRKVTDNLEVFAPPEFQAGKGRWVYSAFARGVRHVEGAEGVVASLRAGDELMVQRDLANEWDALALLLRRADRAPVSFVPHTLVEDLDRVLQLGGEVGAEVVRVNAPPAPVHQRLLVRIHAQHIDAFRPLATARYRPIAAGASRVPLEPILHPR